MRSRPGHVSEAEAHHAPASFAMGLRWPNRSGPAADWRIQQTTEPAILTATTISPRPATPRSALSAVARLGQTRVLPLRRAPFRNAGAVERTRACTT